ncbi:MAG: TIGR01777 family protein [Actinomycetaceae bacterium]|nr:TIGR01777 family protein [Actinomycetaceae bacterium]
MSRPRLVIGGASGFLGRRLVTAGIAAGYDVTVLRRGDAATRVSEKHVNYAAWDPSIGMLDPQVLAGAYGVVSLNGASLFGSLWTKNYKQRMWDSRINSTRTLVNSIGRLAPEDRPQVYLGSSAIGYYGPDTAGEIATEESAPGEGFLADLCQAWEAQALVASDYGVRTVLLRTGLVMGDDGGMLGILQHPYRIGLGVQIGDGSAWMSTISSVDHVRGMLFALRTPEVSGPINLVSPHPIQQAHWHRQLARHLKRPDIGRVPAWAVRVALGQMGKEAALASQRCYPQALLDAGFRFTAPTSVDIFNQVLAQAPLE